MDKDERAKRLRKALRANGGIIAPFRVVQKVTRTEPIPNKGAGKPLAFHYSVSLADKRCRWVMQHNIQRTEQLPLRRRRKGKTGLMKIADLYPVRLPKLPAFSISKPRKP
jgi:hypothetical protein